MKEQHPLENFKWPPIGITVYRGCIISRLVGGFSVFSQKCTTLEELDGIIDASLNSVQSSLIDANGVKMAEKEPLP